MKIKEFIKRNTTGVIIGAILFGGITGVVAATVLTAADVTYTHNNQTTVQGALDDIYNIGATMPIVCYNGTCGKLSYRYWNDNFGNNIYKSNQIPATTYTTRAILEQNYNEFSDNPVYIRSTIINGNVVGHEACLYYNNREFCAGTSDWDDWIHQATNQSLYNNATEALMHKMSSSLSVPESNFICTGAVSNFGGSELLCTVGTGYYHDDNFDENVFPFGIYISDGYLEASSTIAVDNGIPACVVEDGRGAHCD